jgi:hypothetical protein
MDMDFPGEHPAAIGIETGTRRLSRNPVTISGCVLTLAFAHAFR